MALLQSRVQKLRAAAALIFALSLAGFGTSQAAPSKAGPNYVNGLPCNDLCKAYMAWWDQVLAKFRSPQRQARVVISHKKPDRTIHRASATRQLGLDGFAQLRRRSDDAAPPSMETPPMQPVSSAPVEPGTERIFAADGAVAAKPADAGVAANASLETAPVSVTGLVSVAQDIPAQDILAQNTAMQDTATQNTGTRDAGTATSPLLDGRFALSLALALCALLSLLSWILFRRGTHDDGHDPLMRDRA